jgi:hypothetical protein
MKPSVKTNKIGKIRLMGKNHSDELYTPEEAFNLLAPYLPKTNVLYECAVGTGKLKRQIESMGYEVVSTDDYFNDDQDYDILVTNPPFSLKDKFLAKAYSTGKPFAMLLPITALEGIARQKMYQNNGIQILFPAKRTDFNGKKSPWFYTAWFCWKLLPETLVFNQLSTDDNDDK